VVVGNTVEGLVVMSFVIIDAAPEADVKTTAPPISTEAIPP